MGINIEKYFINSELDQMSRYLKMVNRSWYQEFEELDKEYKQFQESGGNDDDDGLILDDYENRFIELGQDFPKLIFGSFVVAWYSFVEQQLLDLCEKRNLRISLSAKESVNLSKGIWRARKFLVDIGKVKIDEKYWQELSNINRLRNFLVHEGYTLWGNYLEIEKPFVIYKSDMGENIYFTIEENLYRYLQKYSMVTHLGTWLQIVPTIEYCEYLISFAKTMFGVLIDSSKVDN